MDSKLQNIIVAGGAGYIGSHVCKYLHENGYAPITVDNLSRGHKWAVQWGPLEYGDIRDEQFLSGVFARHEPVGVVHLAALAYVEESVRNPELYFSNNVIGSIRLLKVMRAFSCSVLVFSSSCAVYGETNQIPIIERSPCKPINPYGIGKLKVEKLLADADRLWGLRSVSLRFFNAAGADRTGMIGELHLPETHLIPLAIDAAMSGAKFKLYGSDYGTPDGTCIRDFIHVNDLASAHYLALNYLFEGGKSDCINLGSGSGASVSEILKIISEIAKRKIIFEPLNRRGGDPEKLVSSIAKAKDILGWEPEYSEISKIIADALVWYKKSKSYT